MISNETGKVLLKRKSATSIILNEWLPEKSKQLSVTKIIHKRVPILNWLPKYTRHQGISDLVAGCTVGLTIIPQAIAYANVAGLPPHYGLYSSFFACFVYTIFGTCRESSIGPTAMGAILTRENLHGLSPEFAVLLCFISGCVELVMGILQLGEYLRVEKYIVKIRDNIFDTEFYYSITICNTGHRSCRVWLKDAPEPEL